MRNITLEHGYLLYNSLPTAHAPISEAHAVT